MSNFFSQALDDLSSLEEEIAGPDYPYYKFIKSPSQIGMGASGSKIADNISGLISYAELLVEGGGKASKGNHPLGNKYFMETPGTCKDKDTGESVTRSVYINNVPDGSIPFVSGMTGENFSEFEGLLPGVLSDVTDLNPLAIFQAFMIGSNPDCQQLTMDTIDTDNVSSTDTAYVLTTDIQNMNACWFKDKKNPITGEKCKEAFSKIDKNKFNGDQLCKIYFGSLTILGFYIFLKLALKNK